METNILALSFGIGFLIAFIIYLLAYVAGKPLPQLRTSVLFIGILIGIAVFVPLKPSITWWQLIRLGLMFYVCSVLIVTVIQGIGDLLGTLYEKGTLDNRFKAIKLSVYSVATLLCIGIILSGSATLIASSFSILLQILFACLGLLLALKLLKKD